MNSTVFNAKNKYIILVIAVIMIIPALLAFYFSADADNDSVSAGRVEKISVSAPFGVTYTVEDKQAISLYSDIIKSAEQINENFRDLTNEKPYVVTIMENDGFSKLYDFYMENQANGCIFTDSEGRYFLISDDDALEILEREEFSYVNTNSVVPNAIITRNGNMLAIEPSGGTWGYKHADGEFSEKPVEPGTSPKPTARISIASLGELSFAISSAPDRVNVVLSKDGVKKHEGSFDTLLNANVMAEGDTLYDLEIKAIWEANEERNFFGTVEYTLPLLYDVAPTYTIIHSGVVSRGDFTVIKIQNFNDADKLFIECDFPFPEELKVFKADGYNFAFLPATYDTNSTGRYKLKFVLEDGSEQTANVTVNPGREPSPKEQDMLIAEPELQSAFTAEAFEEYDKTVAEKTAVTESYPLWDGRFVYPDEENKGVIGTGMAAFGTKRTIRGLYQKEYVHNGIDIAMTEGANVYAANNGKVVFAGSLTLTGNTVIIDHGCSIFTYYGHLESIDVAEGDVVNKQAVIGKAGKTGFAAHSDGAGCRAASQVHFAVSVEGVYVNPYYVWKFGVNYDD